MNICNIKNKLRGKGTCIVHQCQCCGSIEPVFSRILSLMFVLVLVSLWEPGFRLVFNKDGVILGVLRAMTLWKSKSESSAESWARRDRSRNVSISAYFRYRLWVSAVLVINRVWFWLCNGPDMVCFYWRRCHFFIIIGPLIKRKVTKIMCPSKIMFTVIQHWSAVGNLLL